LSKVRLVTFNGIPFYDIHLRLFVKCVWLNVDKIDKVSEIDFEKLPKMLFQLNIYYGPIINFLTWSSDAKIYLKPF